LNGDGACPSEVMARLAVIYGGAGPGLALLTQIDPGFTASFTAYAEAAYRGASLDPRLRQLLLLAHDVSITNLDGTGARNRVLLALQAGATEREVTTVIELVTMVSLHGMTKGFPLLCPLEDQTPDADAPTGGYWAAFETAFPAFHRRMKAANPDAFAAYRAMGEHIWKTGSLDPAWAELVFVVIDLANTHLFTEGAAFHIRNALHYGATHQQVLDAVFLTVPSIVRSLEVGLSAVAEATALFEQESKPAG